MTPGRFFIITIVWIGFLVSAWFICGFAEQQVINTSPGSSDLPVTAFNKANANFTELYGSFLPRTNGAATNLLIDTLRIATSARLPIMTKTQRNALTPSAGMIIFQSDGTQGIRIYQSGQWYAPAVEADP